MPLSFRHLAAVLAFALLPSAAASAAEPAAAEPACVDGEKPTEPFSSLDKWGMQRYDAELARYKRDHERYLGCLEKRGGDASLGRKLDQAMENPQPR
ncbi:MAG TPA: hypothetical protein VLI06_06550 [Solimonas sp.]|nr:hypothetical protein [Solimonas sp.]